MSKSASKIRVVSSVQKELGSFKSRRSVSADGRARGSYVPEKSRQSSEERKSGSNRFSRWGNARKSSINLGDVKRKDARPLTDKAYQKRKVVELVEFLDEAGFSPPISATKLMAPSKKDFENIFQFLTKYLDPKYEVKRIEEDGPKILKNLGYPFTVNKSAFVYVARTNWPSLLGALIWLMDLNKFAMKVDMNNLIDSAGDGEKAQIHSILLRYICQCHHSGTDNEEEENAVFTQIIKSSMRENVEELVEKNKEKKAMIASVEARINELKQLADSKAQLEKNILSYEDYILKMQSHYQKKNETCEQLMEKLKEKEAEHAALQEEVTKLQDAYDAQGFDGKKHMGFLETQLKELKEKLDKKRNMCTEMQDRFHEAEIKRQKCLAEAMENSKSYAKVYNDSVESLNSALDPLSVIKTVQVQKVISNFQLEFPAWDIHFNKCNAESNKAFETAVEKNLEKVKSIQEILTRLCATMDQKSSEIEIKNSEVSRKLKLLTAQASQQKRDFASKKKIAEDEEASINAQCEKIAEQIKSVQEEKSALEKTYREMIAEKNLLIEFQVKKENQLKEFLKHKEEMFEYFEKSEAEMLQKSQAHGNAIAKGLGEPSEDF